MELKKSVEKNPFTYLISCMVAAATLTFSVCGYFAKQEVTLEKNQIADLNSKLASLHREVPGGEFFDIRNLIYSTNSTKNAPPSSSKFFPEQFYAPTGQGDWEYKETTELALISDLIGASPTDLPPSLQQAMTLLKLHLWRGKKDIAIEGHDAFKKIYPLITLEKVTSDQMRTLLGIGAAAQEKPKQAAAPEAKQELVKAIEKDNADSQKIVDGLDKAFRNDMIGSFFTSQLQLQLAGAAQSSRTSFTLLEIQKVGNVLYAQFLITLKDVKVEGRQLPEYYLRKEMIMISEPDGGFFLGTTVPSEDPAPRDHFFAAVSKWLDEFRVVLS
jgi:hypothetical protein